MAQAGDAADQCRDSQRQEVLTFGFKKYGYGEVIGERTAGALLAARAFVLSDDSLMIIAVDDVAVDGERLA